MSASTSIYLVRSGLEVKAGELGDLISDFKVKALIGIQSCTHSRTTLGKLEETRESGLHSIDTILHL